MGCDVHMRAEVRRAARWEIVGPVFDCNWDDCRKTAEPYDDRNYKLFAMLADVRNGYGFAGVPTGQGFQPISDPRGIPEDASPEALEFLRDGLDWGHSHSWHTLQQLREYDWDGQSSVIYGVVKAEYYEECAAKGEAPESWSGGISGPGIVTFTTEGYERWKAAGRPERHKTSPYVRMEWRWTYRKAAGDYWFGAMDKLAELIPEGGTAEDVRIVFYFDN